MVMVPEEMIKGLTNQGYQWVLSQRAHFRDRSRLLRVDERLATGSHFELETLDTARIAQTHEIEEPPFLEGFRKQGVPGLLDFRQTAGIVFVDTVVVADKYSPEGSRWLSLLFHELVHVAQWRLLGPQRMLGEYVKGWASNGFDYFQIPIEVQAYDLQRKFDRNAPAFSVENIVRETFGPSA